MIWKKEKEREREHVPLLGDTLAQEFTTNDTFASLFNSRWNFTMDTSFRKNFYNDL